jgi:hypothetical protein
MNLFSFTPTTNVPEVSTYCCDRITDNVEQVAISIDQQFELEYTSSDIWCYRGNIYYRTRINLSECVLMRVNQNGTDTVVFSYSVPFPSVVQSFLHICFDGDFAYIFLYVLGVFVQLKLDTCTYTVHTLATIGHINLWNGYAFKINNTTIHAQNMTTPETWMCPRYMKKTYLDKHESCTIKKWIMLPTPSLQQIKLPENTKGRMMFVKSDRLLLVLPVAYVGGGDLEYGFSNKLCLVLIDYTGNALARYRCVVTSKSILEMEDCSLNENKLTVLLRCEFKWVAIVCTLNLSI